MKHSTSYSSLQIGLHWLVALFVVAAWFTSEGMGKILHQKLEGAATGLPAHVAIGLVIATTVAVRIVVRLTSGTPGPLPEMNPLEKKARHWGHIVLYVLLIAVPLGGITTWFFGVESVGDIHGLAGNALFFLAFAHAALALWHHFYRKDSTLRRMTSPATK